MSEMLHLASDFLNLPGLGIGSTVKACYPILRLSSDALPVVLLAFLLV